MTEDRHAAVAREYGRLAAVYDRRWAAYLEATVRETLRRLPPVAGGRVLDVACGTGALLRAIGEREPGARLAGIDLAPEMLAVAGGRLPPSVELTVGSADELPYDDGAFDLVVSSNAFHFFRAPQRALAEMHRVLRPGGALTITDWCDDFLACRLCDRMLRLLSPAHHRIYGAAECRALIAAQGFAEIAVERYKISLLWGLMTAGARKR